MRGISVISHNTIIIIISGLKPSKTRSVKKDEDDSDDDTKLRRKCAREPAVTAAAAPQRHKKLRTGLGTRNFLLA